MYIVSIRIKNKRLGGHKMKKNNWYVANDKGDLMGHDLSEEHSRLLAGQMQEDEPDAGWEALCPDEE